YPELKENREYIKKVILTEEERFNKTIDQGMNILSNLMDNIEKSAQQAKDRILSGIEAFKLNDTFGFPFDLTKEILSEHNIDIDEEGFRKYLKEQADRAREARKKNNNVSWAEDLFQALNLKTTEFVGYDTLSADCNVISIAYENEFADVVSVDEEAKEDVLVVLDKTPFYAEAGGQIGDKGTIETENGTLSVIDCKKTAKGYYVHTCTLEKGFVKVMTKAVATVDDTTRGAIERNHSSAHLLQKALKIVLGNHVHQSGSYVDDERLRFDFNHYSAITPQEILTVEKLINDVILASLPVTTQVMSMEEAKKTGAIALFGEKYGSDVRVVKMGDFSTELCGGTHVKNTSQIGVFKIVSETGVAAGVRRIEAVTSFGVLKLLQDREELLSQSSKTLKITNFHELPTKVVQLTEEMKIMQGEIDSLRGEVANNQISGLFQNPVDVEGVKLFAGYFSGTSSDALRQMCNIIKNKATNSVAVLCGEEGGKVTIAVSCGDTAMERGIKAGVLAKEVSAVTGGTGGGKADFAMAGVKDKNLVDEALACAPAIIKRLLK
ncbi:MAG: alanine--tRNA ligase, partial [Oscillospiraceae bacterium]